MSPAELAGICNVRIKNGHSPTSYKTLHYCLQFLSSKKIDLVFFGKEEK
jgi:hypothetical protein